MDIMDKTFDLFTYKIYKITNLTTNEGFVGFSMHPAKRIYEHLGNTKNHGSPLLKAAVRTLGRDNFTSAIIDGANSLEEAKRLTTLYMERFRTVMPLGYNLKTSGMENKTNGGGRAKLTEEQVVLIFYDERPRKEIAEEFGISLSSISEIKNRKKWTYITSRLERK